MMISHEITKTPGVCGGDACFDGSCIPVWLLISYRKSSATDSVILQAYPELTDEHLNLAQKYYEENREEINRNIREQEYEHDDEGEYTEAFERQMLQSEADVAAGKTTPIEQVAERLGLQYGESNG